MKSFAPDKPFAFGNRVPASPSLSTHVLDLAKGVQHHPAIDAGDRHGAEAGIDVVFEAVADSFGVSRRPERPLFRQPDFSELLECRLGSGDLALLLALGLYHRILSRANERAGLFVQCMGVGQT